MVVDTLKVLFIILLTLTPDLTSSSCDSGWTHKPEVGKCFRAYDSFQSYQGAKTNCENVGGTLAMPKTQELHEAMASILSTYREYWIGLERRTGNTDTWLDGTPVSWSYICPCDGKESSCAAYRTVGSDSGGNHYWADASCSSYYRYVCEKSDGTSGAGAVANPCPSGWSHKAYVDRCYWHSGHTHANYEDSKTACANTNGATIAMPKTAEQQAAMVTMLSSSEYWIGLEHMGSNPDQWADGTTPTYDNIYPYDSRGSSSCNAYRAHNSYSFQWLDRSCSNSYRYVCEIIVGTGCSAPSSPGHTTEVVEGTDVGDNITYTCESGTTLTSGDLVRVCQSDRTWNGSAPVCEDLTCGSGWTHKPEVGKCYRAYDSDQSYQNAKTNCENVGGTLAMPKTQELHEAMASILSDREYWIGLERLTGSTDTWLDGTAVSWDYICPCDGKESSCAAYRTLGSYYGGNHYWADISCYNNHRYVCEKAGSYSIEAACEGRTVALQCSLNHVIHIVDAVYGRTNTLTCVHHAMSNTNCNASTSYSVVAAACEGQQSCSVVAHRSTFGQDPCDGTYKYLKIYYNCQDSGIAQPVAFWPLDANSLGTDLSGNGHNGTVHNATPSAGPYGDAHALTFAEASDSHVVIPAHAQLAVQNFTLMFFIYLENLDPSCIFEYASNPVASHIWLHPNGQSLKINLIDSSDHNLQHFSQVNNIFTERTWHRVVVSYSQTTGELAVESEVFDTQESNNNTKQLGTFTHHTNGLNLQIGKRQGVATEMFDGRLSCVHLFDDVIDEDSKNAAWERCQERGNLACNAPDDGINAAYSGNLTMGSVVSYTCNLNATYINGDSNRTCLGDLTWSGTRMECHYDLQKAAFWPFDGNSLGNDFTGRGHHGVLHNVIAAPGPFGALHALEFSPASLSHVTVPAHPDLAVQSFTLIWLMNPVSVGSSGTGCLFEFGTARPHIWQWPSGAHLYANLMDTGGRSHSYTYPNVFTANTWQKAIVQFDRGTGTVLLGVGSLDSQYFNNSTAVIGQFDIMTAGQDFHIGKRSSLNTHVFNGRLSCIHLFNTVVDLQTINEAWELCRERGNLTCSAPEPGVNATYSGNLTMGLVVTYSCNVGHVHASGNVTRTCLGNLTWSGTQMECEVVICSDPGFISNSARLPTTSQNFYGGNNVTYTCDSGYFLANGSLSRVCQDNSTWSDDPPFCEVIPEWSTPCYGDWGHGYYSHCYIINDTLTDWETANDDCHRLGGYIWVPETIAERNHVSGLSTLTRWWVGITDPWYTEATIPLSGSLLKDNIFSSNEPDDLDKIYVRLNGAGVSDTDSGTTDRRNICEQSPAYLGCYRTESGLAATLSSPLHMNLQQCIEYCRGLSRAFAGVSSSECYCTQTVTEANKENDFTLCDTKCPGNKHQFCGGNGYVSMYLVTWISVVASSCDVLYKNGVREYGQYWVAAEWIAQNIRVECFTSSQCNEWLIYQISDSSISASSSRSNLSHTDIRLYGESGWGPDVSADTNGSWVQLSFPNRYIVTGFKTQGRNDIDQLERVQNFTVQYRDTSIGADWRTYINESDENVFDARGPTSSDFNTPVYNEVEDPFVATDIRVLPETGSCLGSGCVMRLDVSGCQFDTFSETAVDIGCFLDDQNHPEFPNILSSGITSTSECRELCAQGGYMYAAVTNGTVCGCGNEIGKYGKVRQRMCNIACTGNPRDACGGELFNSVFRVWSIKCPELPQISNMDLNTTERSHGDVAKYTCLHGYRLPSGTNETDVLRCVQKQWVGDIPAQGCERIVCNGALPTVANATRTDTGNFLDSTATYRCFYGFLYPDESDVQQLRCQDTGAWSSLSHTDCQERLCSAPPDVANATAVFNNRTWTFTCDAGYAVSAGHTTQTLFCNLQGQWVGSVENCGKNSK
ncbi:uncharacterized protein LOC106174934 isoform X2 [Lingula anatina]|uniref:Uncharacterized protein LOC106174934 isoform X2 n=1 Tax=Lingula anatina TaxID=7574 RepID=A0A1S3JP93_LINAN|nr:uncharacterized protein LOC106174934 isoform X2 [Lingula anatina]|eukprot:XP_013412167.1 uncharacterized protein LOC106174934 isoform X2 [Lingula anatina]